MLRGPESGACYIQFESLPTAQKALLRDRQVLRDRSIRVVPAQGLRTCMDGCFSFFLSFFRYIYICPLTTLSQPTLVNDSL